MTKYRERAVVDKAIFVGIDVHLKQSHVTIRTQEEELFTGSIPSGWLSLSKVLKRYRPEQTTVVYEAGYFGYSLYDGITQWGGRGVVTPPSLVPMEYGNRVKTDKRDSRKLAYLLSRGLLRENWVPPVELRYHRQVLRRRRQLMADQVRQQARIKAELLFYGIDVSGRRGRWSKGWVGQLWALELPDAYATWSFRRLLTVYELVREAVAQQTRLLRQLSGQPVYQEPYRWLTSLPGIGPITAMSILLELGDMRRFGRGEQLAAYVGLTPSQYSSGDHVRMGRITRVGKNYLRGLLIEAAWVAIRRDAELQEVYRKLVVRCGGKRAIVAVARRLLLRCRRVLLDGRVYRPTTNA